MGEQDLLHGVLAQKVEIEDVKAWLDNFEDHAADGHSDFKQYDRLSFVVVLLNFLREDAAALLRPGDRWQTADHSCQAGTRQDGATGHTPKVEGCIPSDQPSLPTATKLDMSEYPPLTMGNVTRGSNRGGKQKRRIRPTTVSDADKPSEGDITDVAASPAPPQSRMDDAAAGRSSVGPSDSIQHNCFKSSSDVVDTSLTMSPEGHQAQATGRVLLEQCREERRAIAKLVGYAGTADEEHCEEGDAMYLRAATSGSLPLVTRRCARTRTPEGDPGTADDVSIHDHSKSLRFNLLDASVPEVVSTGVDELDPTSSRQPTAGVARGLQFQINDSNAGNATRSSFQLTLSQATAAVCTPTKTGPTTGAPPSDKLCAPSDCLPEVPQGMAPVVPSTPATGKKDHWMEQPVLASLASLYVHTLLQRLVPNLATEMHLTVRLLHVHPSATRESGIKSLQPEYLHGHPPLASEHAHSSDVEDSVSGVSAGGLVEGKRVFKTGLDCRAFAARVIMGLDSLLPHVGTDTLDLLMSSTTLSSEPENLMEDLRRVLCQARGDSHITVGDSGRILGQHHADDTAIVQNVGAPYAALQWRKEDSLKHCRTGADRALFQNQQETVDRFGSLLRNYQGSKKGLQQYPERALQDLRTAASTLLDALAPGNFGWLAQYLLAQLVGWGLAPPQETDTEVMALVAPAGNKGLATLQKLHNRISAPISGEDGRVSKSSQKLRQPVAHADGLKKSSHPKGRIDGSRSGQPQPRPRKSGPGPRQSKSQPVVAGVRIPTAPLQLRWFPGNQEFFYHVVMALDSHVLNRHLKTALIAEIAELHHTQSRRDRGLNEARQLDDADHVSGGHRGSGDGVGGFTDIMVKLKVLAKFLGLLTFSPNWGVPANSSATPRSNVVPLPAIQEYAADLPLPLLQYLRHAWSTEGLVGVVPWVADFLRMMKWDVVSMQADTYRSVLVTLAQLHARPRMRPGHPRFTQGLLAVSCEIETLFQELGHDLGAHDYLTSSSKRSASAGAFNTQEAFGSARHAQSDTSYSLLQTCDTSGSQQQGLFAEGGPQPTMGSLDSDVVLSRRLIQNCYPFLEDVLTLIGNLDRTWRLGLAHSGESTPFGATRSPRLVAGVSPRSKRIIKPHPLRPLPTMPSVPENRDRPGIMSTQVEKQHRGPQTDSARVRLVESFFHSQPSELQTTADFVVRRAVHNSCEDTLATLVRPAVAAIISQLELASRDIDEPGRSSAVHHAIRMYPLSRDGPDGSSLPGQQERQPMTRLEHRAAWTTAALQQSVGCKAKAMAGKRAHVLARESTSSLAPQSLPLRVRETAAAIAGHHAKFAAEKKIRELTATAASEAAAAYHARVEEELKEKVLFRQQLDSSGNLPVADERKQSATLLGSTMHFRGDKVTGASSSAPILTALVLELVDVGQSIGADVGRKHELMQDAQRVMAINGEDVQAVADVVRETLHVAHSAAHRQQCGIGENTLGFPAHVLQTGQQIDLDGVINDTVGSDGSKIATFLILLAEVWASLYSLSHSCQRSVVYCLQGGGAAKATVAGVYEDLVVLASLAVKAVTSESGHFQGMAGQPDEVTTTYVDSVVSNMPSTIPATRECPPWLPALELMLWGAISAVEAENTLLSLLNEASSEQAEHSRATQSGIQQPLFGALNVVITALVEGYHSRAVQEIPRVSVANALDCAVDSLATFPAGLSARGRYHPMNLSRVAARLAVV